jgi:outer membrane protein assembly factor BamC
MKVRAIKLTICLLACFSVSACSYLDSKRKADYKNSHQLPPLDLPPDLTATADPGASSTAPSQPATYSGFTGDKQTGSTASGPVVPPPVQGVSLERDGSTRWLLVQASPENLWPFMRQFVTINLGLAIERENPTTGVLETDWLDRQAKSTAEATLPTEWLRRTSMRDKFRLRLERGSKPNTTEIFVSHYGVSAITEGRDTRWQPRAPEPDIESEVLRLLIAYLGKTDVQAKTIVAQAAAPLTDRARLVRRGDSYMLNLDDALDRAWRRLGLSLDRAGFTVEDRDRSKGVYYVRYLDPDKQQEKPGWFAKLFGADDKKSEERYQIQLQSAAAGSQVVVRTSDGTPEFGNTSERILSLLYEQLK